MIINNENVNSIDDFLNNENQIILQHDVSNETACSVIKSIIEFEKKHPDRNIRLTIKKISTEILIIIFSYILKNISDIHNASLILNVVALLKTYNTFSDDFFESDDIFINDIEQFLDIKIALEDDIQKLRNSIAEYFISLIRSLSKVDYVMTDNYQDLPCFYVSLFNSFDLITISGLLSTVPDDYSYNFHFIKNAEAYLMPMLKKYVLANDMIHTFLDRFNNGKKE